jgi:ABC-type oligopeptide transport system substrate-binding subunit
LSDITGFAAFNQEGTSPLLAGVAAATPTDFRVSLEAPFADLPALFSNPAFGIVAPESVPGLVSGAPLVTSGPFTIASRSGRRLDLVPAHRASTYVDRVIVSMYGSADEAFDAFDRGGVDWAAVPPNIPSASARSHGRLDVAPVAAELLYGINRRDPALADRRVRQSLVQAVDAGAIRRATLGDTAVPLRGLIASGVAGASPNPCGVPCAYNPSLAS